MGSRAMQQYTAANLSLAWDCRIEPTDNPSVWLAWRGGDHPVAALWIDAGAAGFEQAEANAQAALGRRSGPGMITVMAVSASSALWSAGHAAPRELAMPVTPRRPPTQPRWWCETCGGRHPIEGIKACLSGRRHTSSAANLSPGRSAAQAGSLTITRNRPEEYTMGEWTIVIQGHGIHDNGRDDDADAICQRFVEELAKSQQVQSAQFTVGVRRALGVPVPEPSRQR